MRCVDERSAVYYSSIVQVTFDCVSEEPFHLFPNPINRPSVLTIHVDRNLKLPAQLQVLDIYGRLVRQQKITQYSQELGTNDLAPGVYQVVFRKGLKQNIQRLIIQ